MSHVVSGLSVAVRGRSYSFGVTVGDGHACVCSSLFVDFDRGQPWWFVGGRARFVLWWAVVV
jgi:hypothetical protein